MYRNETSKEEEDLREAKLSHSDERDEILRRLAQSLILRQTDGGVRTPVITLATDKTCIYNVLERHYRAEALLGADRWWRVCKTLYEPPLETWRPRVYGVQLKALHGARLPETADEWEVVKSALLLSVGWIKNDSSADILLDELKDLACYSQTWWESRTKREGSAGPSKRSVSSMHLPASKRAKGGGPEQTASLPSGLAAVIPAYQGPGGEPLQHLLGLMGAEQAGNAYDDSPPQAQTVLLSEPQNQILLQISQLSSRSSAVTMLAGEIQQAEIVPLNIGGRLLQTEISTLTAVPTSYLAQLARHWQSFPQQPIFLDRNPQAFERLLEHLRAAKFGEDDTALLTTDVESLQSLHREAKHFALEDIAMRIECALGMARARRGDLATQSGLAPSECGWQYDVAFADTGFHSNMKEAVQLPMKTLNEDLQERLAEGWEIFSTSSSTVARSGRGGGEEKSLCIHFFLRRPLSASSETQVSLR